MKMLAAALIAGGRAGCGRAGFGEGRAGLELKPSSKGKPARQRGRVGAGGRGVEESGRSGDSCRDREAKREEGR